VFSVYRTDSPANIRVVVVWHEGHGHGTALPREKRRVPMAHVLLLASVSHATVSGLCGLCLLIQANERILVFLRLLLLLLGRRGCCSWCVIESFDFHEACRLEALLKVPTKHLDRKKKITNLVTNK
jgi:hypothetical protein